MSMRSKRNISSRGVWLSCFLLAAGPALSSELQGENLIQPLPAGYEVGYQAKQNGIEIIEYVPQGETVENWTEMVTTQIMQGRQITPAAALHSLEASWLQACPGSEAMPFSEGNENGYPSAIWVFTCPLNPDTGRPEIAWIKAIEGGDSLFLVQKAFRYIPKKKEESAQWAKYLNSVMVCDTRIVDRACPVVSPISHLPSHRPGSGACLDVAEVTNQMTPVNLFASVQACLSGKDYGRAAKLQALALLYGRVDASRVADKTAHQAIQALQFNAFAASSDAEKEVATERFKSMLQDSGQLKSVCASIKSLGPPAYYPGYMIAHGMSAFLGKTEGPMVDGFDMKTTWQESLNGYLKCP